MKKRKMFNNMKQEKGITLVALVVTIIVLLILAFIGISILMGDNGVINKAGESKDATIRAQEREYIKLSYQKLEVEKSTKGFNITADKLAAELKNYDENTSVKLTEESEIGNKEIVIKKEFATDYAEVIFKETDHKYIVSFEIDSTKIRHTITFNANGGYGGPTIQEKIEGEDLIITTETPERKWNAFVGWSEDSSATTAQYKGGDRYTKEENATLYAVWTPSWKEEDAVAQIGSTKYITIQEAIEVCSKEASDTQTTIVMLKNTEEEFVTYEGQNIILDLGGHTVTSESTGALCTNNGKIQIINGELRSNIGTTILNNGEITIGDDSTGINSEIPTIYGYNLGVENKGIFNFYDGKIQGIVPIKGNVTKTPEEYGPVSTKMEGNITTVQLGIVNIYEARIGWVYYTTLQKAIDVAKSKETVTIIKDIQLKETAEVSAEKDIALDLYGYTLNIISNKDTVIKNYGNLEIIDNSMSQTGNISIISSNSGSFGKHVTTSAIINENNGKLIINGGTLEANTTNSYNDIYGIYNNSIGDIILQKGKVECNNTHSEGISYGIYNANVGNIKIEDGTVVSNSADTSYGIYNLNSGNINLLQGIIYSKTTKDYGQNSPFDGAIGIYNKIGEINISGGEINTKGRAKTYGIYNNDYGKVKLIGGKIESSTTGGANYNNVYGIYNRTGTLESTNFKIECSANGGSYYNSGCYGIYNVENGIMKVEAETTINCNQGTYRYGIYNNSEYAIINGGLINEIYNLGKMQINKGKIENGQYGIYNLGTVIIGNEKENYIQEPEIIGNEIGIYSTGIVEFYSGKIEGKKEALSGDITKIRDLYMIKQETIENKQSLYLIEKLQQEYTVQIGEKKFYSIQEAIKNVNESEEETIQVIKNFELNESIQVDKNIIIDLNGYVITNRYFKIENMLKLKITDTSQKKEGKIECINKIRGIENKPNAKLVIEEGTINNSTSIKNGYTIYNNKGEIEIINGTIESNRELDQNSGGTESKGNYAIYNNLGIVTLKGGIISSNITSQAYYTFIYSYGIFNAGELNVEGGTINSQASASGYNAHSYSYGIYNNNKVEIKELNITTNSSSRDNGASYGIYNSSTGIVNVTVNITINTSGGSSYGIYNYGTGSVEIKYGFINSISDSNSYGIYNSSSGKVIIGVKEDLSISQEEPLIQGKSTGKSTSYNGYGIYNTKGKLYFFDGKIEGSTKAVYDTITEIEKNTELKYNEDETILILTTEKIPIAQIGENVYTDLQEAINSTDEEATTIKLLRNIVYTLDNESIIIHNTKNIILDLNGYKITSAISGNVIQNEGALEIKDTSESQTGTITTSSEKTINNINGGKLTITGGTIENRTKYGIYTDGDVIITGGSIICSNNNYNNSNYGIYNASEGNVRMTGGNICCDSNGYSYGIYNASTRNVKIIDGIVRSSGRSNGYGIYNANIGNIEIIGGTLSDSNYAIYNYSTGSIIIGEQADDEISQITPIIVGNYGIYNLRGELKYYDGIVKGATRGIYGNISEIEKLTELLIESETINGKLYEVVKLQQKKTNVASVNNLEYESIQKAIEACGTIENTVTILRDSEPGETVIIEENQNITIDLNGYTISSYTELQNKGTLKITDSSETKTGRIIGLIGTSIQNTGILEIKDGSISDSGYGIKNAGTLKLTGGNITNNTYGIYNDVNGIVEIQSGTISTNTYGIYDYTNTVKNNIMGGNIESNKYGIYSKGTTNITEGKIMLNEYGIYNSGGTTNISSTGISSNTYGIYVAGGTTTVKEGAEIQSNTGVYVSNGTLNIGETGTVNSSSPVITGEEYGLSVASTATVNMYDGQVKGKTGATQGFITNTETGYTIANKTEEEYFVDYLALAGTADSVAEVNGINYSNLQSAINSVTGTETQTIKLTNGLETDTTFTIKEGQNIILDMNGKTIQSSASIAISNAGKLTVIDSSNKNVAKISSTTGVAINNTGTLTLGQDDGTVSQDIITIEGATYGIENTGTLNFYDGTIIGDIAISGTVTNKASGYNIETTTLENKQKCYLTK